MRTLLLCTHLFWSAQRVDEATQESEQVTGQSKISLYKFHWIQSFQVRDSEKVLACLKKATKLTTQVMDHTAQVQLYNELLNSYIYFFNQNHPDVNEELQFSFFLIA